MLSKYSIKYIEILSERLALFEWYEKNNWTIGSAKDMTNRDLEEEITAWVQNTNFGSAVCASALYFWLETQKDMSEWSYELVGTSGGGDSTWAMPSHSWLEALPTEEDKKKGCLYIAHCLNKAVFDLKEKLSDIGLSNTGYEDEDKLNDYNFDSLPLQQAFMDVTTKDVDLINLSNYTSFASFDNNKSYYADQYSDFKSDDKKADVLRWYLAPQGLEMDIAVQISPYSYTQVANPNLEDADSSSVDLNSNIVYFEDGEPQVAKDDFKTFIDNTIPLEEYALSIQDKSEFSIVDISIDIMLDRLRTVTDVSRTFTNKKIIGVKSLSYKMIFSIDEQQTVIVPSVDLYQSLLFLKATDNDKVSLFYDKELKRVIIKGKTYTNTSKKEIKIPRAGRGYDIEIEEQTNEIPTFAIVYEQELDQVTAFTAIEYVEFFDEGLTFKQKYDKLNTVRNSPLELPEEFIADYPTVSETYNQQVGVALSNKNDVDKYEYMMALVDEYINSYTEIIDAVEYYDPISFKKLSDTAKKSKLRKAIPSDEWNEGDYVLKVQEAYWNYNATITNEELLSFFISKGNIEGMRLLCLKILGVDYHLFEAPIINTLLESGDVYISKMRLDEANITADIKYQTKMDFLSGNIYEKKNHINETSENSINYKKGLQIFFGDGEGDSLFNKAAESIDIAITSRFVPSIVPNVKNPLEVKALELNIDINNPIFFKGQATGGVAQNSPTMLYTNLLGTAEGDANNLQLRWDGQNSANYKYGHYELFYNWLQTKEDLILGVYTVKEIKDAYIFPSLIDEYIYAYVLSMWKDADNKVVGFNLDTWTGKLLSSIPYASEDTRLVLKELKLIADLDTITPSEAEQIKKIILLLYKLRCWGARREGRRLFNEFLRKGISAENRADIDLRWNVEFNNYAKPDLNKVPMFPSHSYKFGKRSESNEFNLMEAQKEGIRHVLSRKNSGLFLHEVGFGKTTSSITAISSMMNTGETSRCLFLVPNSVYDKFQDEIVGNQEAYGLLPNVNIVLLGSLTKDIFFKTTKKTVDGVRRTILKNLPENERIKSFTDLELEIIESFVRFDRQFKNILATLKRGYVTFPNDPIYISGSSWEEAYDRIKDELTNYVKEWASLDVVRGYIDQLQNIYNEANGEFQEIVREQERKIERAEDAADDPLSPSSAEAAQIAKVTKRANDVIKETAEKLGKRLSTTLKKHIQFVGTVLVDDLGAYTERTLRPNSLIIAKHSAAEHKLRPSKQAVLRALMFKEGLGEPMKTVESLDYEEWKDISGLTSNVQINPAFKVLKKHPISITKLNIDSLVVDEIHNFNNQVKRAGGMGFEHSGQKTVRRNTNQTRANRENQEYYALEKFSQAARNRYAIKYDSFSNKPDKSGSRLSASALCFDIQYKSKDLNNVLLLSATPFTDTPFQVVSVLGMANYDMLQDNGIKDAWNFFNNYVDEIYKYDLRHDGGYGLFIDINGYYNDKALSNLITNVANVKITDERIEASRPKKAIIPANKLKKSTEDEVATTTTMGDVFEELELVNSRVELSENQRKFQDIMESYLQDDNDQRPIKEVFPINENRETGVSQEEIDEEVEKIIAAKYEEALNDKDIADFIVGQLMDMYARGKYAQHPRILEGANEITKKILKESVETPEEDEAEAVSIDSTQMTAVQKLAGKAIGVQQAQQSLVISPYFVNLGGKNYSSPFLPDLEPNPSQVFVEESPKLMFIVKSIQQTIDYQKQQLANGEIDKIGGQVVYFDTHKFSYNGKSYNGFDLLAEYIADNVEGVSNEKSASGDYIEIAKVEGGTSIKDTSVGKGEDVAIRRGRTSIKNGFNSGEIKVLIGSKAIKEGIDLQGNSHTMYIAEAEFSPEVAMQLEGRIWRQKNPYDVVRVVYVLAMNTIDSFVYSKINKKVNQIKQMLELGVYEMNTTQFVIDTKEMLIQLESDPDKLTEIEYNDIENELTEEVYAIDKEIGRLELVKRKYEEISTELAQGLPNLSKIYRNLRSAIETSLKQDEVAVGLRREKAKLISVDYVAEQKKGYKKSIEEWKKDPKSSYDKAKYKPTQKEIDDAYLDWIKENPKRQPFAVLENDLTLDTQMSEIEKIANVVGRNLRSAENVEYVWRRLDEKGQKEFREGRLKKEQLIWLAYFDVTENEDLMRYLRSIRKRYVDSIENINVMNTYQSYFKNSEENYTIDDADTVISIANDKRATVARKLENKDNWFKNEIREGWVKALAARTETNDGTTESLIESMKGSLPLIRLRNKVS